MKKITLIIMLVTGCLFSSCKREYKMANPKNHAANSESITIDTIIARYKAHYNVVPPATKLYRFTTDVSLTCTVTADEVSGNIYKTVFVQDGTGSLQIKLINSGGLYIGDQININLNGVVLNDYAKMIQLDSIDIEKRIFKINSGNIVTPVKMTMNQIMTSGNGIYKYQSKLVLLDSVEFAAIDKGQLFSDANGKFSIDRGLQDSHGNNVIVRTSGYANFAGNIIPCGKGSLIAIMGQYNSGIQLTLRNLTEVNLGATGCPLLVKSFDDGSATSGGWINYNVTANIDWLPYNYSNQSFAKISNKVAGVYTDCISWFISPPLNISNSYSPSVCFQSAFNTPGPAVEFLVSTNYISGNPNTAAWATLNPALPLSQNYVWTNSGILSLNAYKSSNTRIAFKYTGTGSNGSIWEIDNIAVFGE